MSQKIDRRNTYSQEILNQFKPFKNSKGLYAIELAPNRFLHWIESSDHRPVTCSNPDICMQQFNFIEEAEAIIDYLRDLWNPNPLKPLSNDEISITVDLERNKKLKGES